MPLVKQIQLTLISNSSIEGRAAHNKFVPGIEKVFGVRMPVLNELAKQYKYGGFELVQALWEAGSLEEKTLAIKITWKNCKTRSCKIITTYSTVCEKYRQLGCL